MKLISQGAEAKIYLIENPRKSAKSAAHLPHNKFISKQRIPKLYRHKDLDNQIRTRRTKSETKILTKAFSVGANVPKVISSDKYNLEIEFIQGDRLSETLNAYPKKKQFQIMQQLGEQVALLHKNNIIHGDLTTSNIILKTATPLGSRRVRDKVAKAQNMRTEGSPSSPPLSPPLFLIDFGLSFISTKTENKAVDLHLIKQALEAKHFQNHQALFQQFLKTYNIKENIERLKTVEKRGRYKH